MRRRLLLLALMAALLLPAQAVRAENGAPAQMEHADEYEQAAAAFLAHTPGAVVDYALRERDDGRYEWDLFFTLDGQFGQCEVAVTDYKVRSVFLRDMPDNALTASEAVEALVREKGELQIVDLELDVDDGRLRYEGEAMAGEKRYEFEMDVYGKIIEWERD